WCWHELAARLLPDYRVLLPDNRGSGRSDPALGGLLIADLADDAAEVLVQLGGEPAHVIGHSMGGYIALELALRHPGLVRSAILVCTTMGGPGAHFVPAETLAAWHRAAPLGPVAFAERTMPISLASGWPEDHPERYRALIEARLSHPTAPTSWACQFQACAAYLATGVPIEDLVIPLTIVHGSDDRVVPFENSVIMHQRVGHSRFVPMDGSGHLCFLEEPERFAQIVEEHLRIVRGDRS
ncbi:MAG: alpha/beta fold hydrolase, partial [Cyanobacteria bacterium REEB65]|nr:alpha/beta fold hydrolase [Cyanobacteria bacterium REEB65]